MLLQLIIVQVVTFLAIVLTLRKFLYAESAKETLRLKKLKEESVLKQKELQEKIDQAKIAYDAKMSDAEKSSSLLRARSEADAKELRGKILDKAKEDAENILKAAYNAKEKMREEISVEMARKAPLLATRIFSAVLSEEVKKATHQELIKDVTERVKRLDPSTFKTPVDHGEIASAHSLPAADRSALEAAVRSLLGQEIPLQEKKDASITAGLVLKLGSIIIDGSLENRMRQAERELIGEQGAGARG